METKHGKHGGSAFFWGLIIGALLATLLTTKKGRIILRELVNLGLELIEEIIEDKRQRSSMKAQNQEEAHADSAEEELEETAEDLASEITEEESAPAERFEAAEHEHAEPTREEPRADREAATEAKSNGNGHHKKRLFRGVRRK